MVSKFCVLTSLTRKDIFFLKESCEKRNLDSSFLGVALQSSEEGRKDEDYWDNGWRITEIAYGSILEWPVEAVGEPPEGL